jgi:hypothetical protein
MPHIYPNSPITGGNRKEFVVWGSDSFTQLNLNCSLASFQQPEPAAAALLQEIEDALKEQANRKYFLDVILEKSILLAKARYLGGSKIGAILSMRKVHKSTSTKAYIAGARYQLTTLRDMVQATLDQTPPVDIDIMIHRNMLYGILADVAEAKPPPMPTNDDLLRQIRVMLEKEESM